MLLRRLKASTVLSALGCESVDALADSLQVVMEVTLRLGHLHRAEAAGCARRGTASAWLPLHAAAPP